MDDKKYKEVDKSTISDAIIPPSISRIKVIDTETGESATGTGWSPEEARTNAHEKLDKGERRK